MEIFRQKIQVRWSDLDPNGHVRHSVYYDYGAQIRIAYLQQLGFDIAWMSRNGLGPVLFREEAKFHRELNSGDELVVDLQTLRPVEDPPEVEHAPPYHARQRHLCSTRTGRRPGSTSRTAASPSLRWKISRSSKPCNEPTTSGSSAQSKPADDPFQLTRGFILNFIIL